MTNYEKKLQEMTIDQMAKFMEETDACAGTHIDGNYECHAPEGVSCFQCIKNWLMQEAEEVKR